MNLQNSIPDPYIADLAASIDASHIRAHLSDLLADSTIVRLRAIRRTQYRLIRLCFPDMEIPPSGVAGADVLAGHDPRKVIILAGAIWHARSLLKLVAGAQISAFEERVGEGIQSIGLRHLSLASQDGVIESPEELAEAVKRDGQLCLSAWLQNCSPFDRQRVLVRAEAGFSLPPCPLPRIEQTKKIVSQVLSHLNRQAQGSND